MAKISFTEIMAWKTCRQRWAWKYGMGLEPVRYAEYVNLGTLCHAGVEAELKGEPIEHGVIRQMGEMLPKDTFAEEWEEAEKQGALAVKVVERFVTHYGLANALCSAFKTVAVEKEFDLAIPKRRDRIQGRFDAVVEDSRKDQWLVEFKFPRAFRTEEDTALSTQLAIYQWAANRCGYPVVGVLYVQILPRLPEIPAQNKDGSTSKREIYTDWQTYAKTVRERGDNPENYREEMLPKLETKEFWRAYRLYRSPAQVERYVQELRAVAGDIAAKNKRIYTCENAVHCSGCPYRNLCLEVAAGRDSQPIIQSAYKKRQSDEPDTDQTNGEAAAFYPT